MSMKLQVKFLLMCGCILHALTAKGAYGQCSTPPINQVVYEGKQSTIMTCNSPTKVSWFVLTTSEELFTKQITNYSDDVIAYPSLYNVTQTNLNIEIGQSYATPNISTSGVYIAQYNSTASNNKFGAKLVVIRNGPTCNCSAINLVNQTLTCSITYADGSYNPIYANFKWTADGALFAQSTISTRTRVNNAFTSTYAITTSLYDTRTFQCNVTFAKPTSVSFAYIATNAPAFYAICNTSCAPLNRVIYEGATNTTIKCKSKELFMDWAIIPYPSTGLTSMKFFTLIGKIIPPFNELFAVDHTQGTDDHTLVVYNATISPSGRANISTTGFYQCRTITTFTAAQLVVVRNDPICSSNLTQSTASCTIVYGGYREFPIDAVMSWSVNGQPIPSGNATFTINPTLTEITATSTIVVDPNSDATYECATKFSQPANNPHSSVANNAPDYYKTCTISIASKSDVGCWGDTNDRDLPYEQYMDYDGGLTLDFCVMHCYYKGFLYAAAQFGIACFCGNSYGRYGPSTGCNMVCPGDHTYQTICGGEYANSVMSTGFVELAVDQMTTTNAK